MTAAAPSFDLAARKAELRVALRQALGLMSRTRWFAGGVLAFLIGWQFAGGSDLVPWLAWGVVIIWAAGCLGFSWWRRPGAYSALALWDQAAGRREAFASAWWFARQPARTAAAGRHITAQQEALAAALPALARDLPLRPDRWLALAPVLAAIVTSIAVIAPPRADTLALDDEAGRTAREEAKKLAATDWEKKNLTGLKADEQKDLEKLKEKLQDTAKNLEDAAGKDAREVMADLEKRARDAEKLAEQLADKDAWASDKLVNELRRHADTADLGDAVAAKNPAQTAKAADALAQQLQSPQLTSDARERLNETLKETEQQAEPEDNQRTVGQHVLGAADQLQQTQPVNAGEEFKKLADKMRDLARREAARKELEKLAQQLRDAGSNIAGQNQAGGMQQMTAGAEQQDQAGQQGQSGQVPQVGQAQQGQQALQPPGLGQMGQGQPLQQMSPVPGAGQPMMIAQGQPGQGQPLLFAPIPGQKPGEKPDAFILGPPGQPPGDGPQMAIALPGGNKPGVGKADLNAEPTAKKGSAAQSLVAAQQNNEGQSSVRAVEGGTRKEAASRSAAQMAVEFLQAEEQALDDSALPPGRRDQVRRYFTELRKRFEGGK